MYYKSLSSEIEPTRTREQRRVRTNREKEFLEMSEKEAVLVILRKIKATVDFEQACGILGNGYLDSLEFLTLITELGAHIGVEIPVDEITPENFNTAETIAAMIERLKPREA